MEKTDKIPIPHYCSYEGVLKIHHTCLPTPHTDLSDYISDRNVRQLRDQKKNVK